MPTTCCVPGCKSNYNAKENISVFQFPNDEKLKEKWISAIHRVDFIPKSRTVVCIKHFAECFIIREDSVTRADGTILTVKRNHLKLTKDAFPTIFPNCPAYLSEKLPLHRKYRAKRKLEVLKTQEPEMKLHEHVYVKLCENKVCILKKFYH